MGIPTVPLTELYNRAGDYIAARGGEVRFRTNAESFRAEFADVNSCCCRAEKKALIS